MNEYIIITFPRKVFYQVTVIFKSEDFQLNKNELTKKFKNDNKLGKLKKVEQGIIINGCILNPNILDYRRNNKDGSWVGKGEKRGGENLFNRMDWL